MVVTTIVLPLETERNVDGDWEGVEISFGCEVVVKADEDVEVKGMVEEDEADCATEVDDDDDDDDDEEVSLELVDGGGGVDVDVV